ncbi:apolipoprotein N-acyltransferase [Cypionkella sp.]|uniref:apolipoprotein N-acyltransferase n=1 Tax=Cypionkella sp. TaxID=2811411 RepID=UPI00263139CA|nr:apolipoprotein N-acyltransferase [Cypionkella sp.]MDB5665855.1 lnt [Cypionkella sp.]
MASNWSGLRPISVAALLGVLVATGQAPLGAWYLALPALAGLCWLIARSTAPVWLAWFAGAGYFAAALNWIVQPFMVDVAKDGWMAPFALVFLAFGMALFWALAGLLSRYARSPAIGFAIALAATDLLRGYVRTGFPWALIGHIWIDTPVAQLAAYVGPSGLSLLTALLAAGLASRRPLPAGLAIVSLAAAWTFGMWTLAQPMPNDRPVTLRLVQPNAEQQAKWDPDLANQFFNRLLAFTEAKPTPDLVIWPETSLPYLLDLHPEIGGMIASAGNGASVAIGMQRVEGDKAWNSLAIIAPDGIRGQTYDKHHLVPFGEYIPFGDTLLSWSNIAAFASQAGNGYMAGPGPQLLDFGPKLGRALPLICYEAVFPQDLRGTERPDWLLQITNDAWFGHWTGPFQHAAQARLRAIEQGLPLVRVANTGVTAVYDARGRITASLPFETASYLDAALPAALPATIYAVFGEYPVLLLLLGLFLRQFAPHKRRGA